MTGLILHLAGPMQYWGASGQGGRVRPTHPHPTFSGVVGMMAAALGRPRGHSNEDLCQLAMTVRIDRPGKVLTDWHTVGGGMLKERTVITADGKRRGTGLIFEDVYLADAAFTVALCGPDDTLAAVTRALKSPVYPPYLGKRSCPASPDLVVHRTTTPVQDLENLPLHRPAPFRKEVTVPVSYVYSQPPPEAPDAAPSRYLDDGLTGTGKRVSRPVWDVQREVPAAQCAGLGMAWLTALTHQP